MSAITGDLPETIDTGLSRWKQSSIMNAETRTQEMGLNAYGAGLNSGSKDESLTDLHCHLLPGVDDGARHLDQSLAMARLAVEDGIGTIVVTPHHLNGVYTNRAGTVREHVQRLGECLQQAGIPLALLPGSELHLTPELPDAIAGGQALTIADRAQAVLVELPVHTVPLGAERLLEQLMTMGLTPVIAHPERNTELRRRPQRLREWIDMGCLGQVTAQSTTGQFGERVRRAAKTMIRAGSIHIVASDAHRDRRRIPVITPAYAPIAEWTSTAVADLLLRVFPPDLAAGRSPELRRLREALSGIEPKPR